MPRFQLPTGSRITRRTSSGSTGAERRGHAPQAQQPRSTRPCPGHASSCVTEAHCAGDARRTPRPRGHRYRRLPPTARGPPPRGRELMSRWSSDWPIGTWRFRVAEQLAVHAVVPALSPARAGCRRAFASRRHPAVLTEMGRPARFHSGKPSSSRRALKPRRRSWRTASSA